MQNVDDPINLSIRNKIRSIRQSKRISVRQAARRCDIPESSYSCMENGFYRISLQNLNKMLAGLGATIEDVWPGRQSKVESPIEAPERLNHFRFREVNSLSGARKAALFSSAAGRLRCLYSANLDGQEKAELAEMIEVGLNRGWSFFCRRDGDRSVHLCLLEPVLAPHLRRLVDVYLDLWLASGLAESEVVEREARKNRGPARETESVALAAG